MAVIANFFYDKEKFPEMTKKGQGFKQRTEGVLEGIKTISGQGPEIK